MKVQVGVSLLSATQGVRGGLSSYVHELARALAQRGSEQYTFFAPRAVADYWREYLPTGATIVGCSVSNAGSGLRAFYELLRLPRRALKSGCHVVFYPNSVAPVLRTLPAIVTVHDLMYLSQSTFFSPFKRLYLDWTYKRLRNSDVRIITVSEFCRYDIHERLGIPLNRIQVIHHGVNARFLSSGDSHASSSVKTEYLLSVAGAYPHKRLPLLVDAFGLISSRHPQMQLTLAGTDSGQPAEQAKLRAAIAQSGVSERIRVLGALGWDEMPSLYARATALIQASAFEGFGLPIAEAMVSGTPVIAAPAPGVLEVLGGWGEVAPGWSASDLAVSIERVIGWSEAQRASHTEGAKLFASARFRWELAAQRHAAYFTAIATERL